MPSGYMDPLACGHLIWSETRVRFLNSSVIARVMTHVLRAVGAVPGREASKRRNPEIRTGHVQMSFVRGDREVHKEDGERLA